VTPAPLTISASSARIVFGQAIPAFTASYSGFLLNDGPNGLEGTLSFSLPDGAPSHTGQFPVMPGGLSAANYAITYIDGFLNVVAPPDPAPPVTVKSIQWQTRSLGHKKTARVLVVTFSAPLDPSDAQDASAYHLLSSRPGQKASSVGGQSIPIASAIYNPSAHTVTLAPRGKLTSKALRLQLSINSALVRDSQGRPIDGNLDGQAGGNFVSAISRSSGL
jgi:hypothetical protein